ncbi:hypothetical protein NEDG_00039 [Nematocida displodere]|uniref:Uncharacterized protein n=1 Tax=Nematocida displodere TaxID=1805483 RepID=A0A177EHV7_9MICR|nr:hypothetical protein NEDG_00039 [Nematocida displodere]
MGFIFSKLYRGNTLSILVLKPWQAKRYSLVDEFFSSVVAGFRVLFKYANEYMVYHKITAAGRTFSVLEMHNHQSSDVFWDCVQNMHGVIYFIESLSSTTIKEVLARIDSIKVANQTAALLLVVISTAQAPEDYILFKKSVKYLLAERRYLIVDGHDQKHPHTQAPITKDAICQGLSWILEEW